MSINKTLLSFVVSTLSPFAQRIVGDTNWKYPLTAFLHFLNGNGKDWQLPSELVEECKEAVNNRLYTLLASDEGVVEGYNYVVDYEDYPYYQVPNGAGSSHLEQLSPLALTIGGFTVFYNHEEGNTWKATIQDTYNWHEYETQVPTKLLPIVDKLPTWLRNQVGLEQKQGTWFFDQVKLNDLGMAFTTKATFEFKFIEPEVEEWWWDGTTVAYSSEPLPEGWAKAVPITPTIEYHFRGSDGSHKWGLEVYLEEGYVHCPESPWAEAVPLRK